MYYTGTSGLVLPYPNKSYYPKEFQDKSRITFYGSLFNSIEINSSFYRIPQAATVRKWSESVPSTFKFTFKLWREITHSAQTSFNPDAIIHFMNAIEATDTAKKGSILIQFPPSFKIRQHKKLVDILETISGINSSWKLAVEFRDDSWYQPSSYELLNAYHASLVVHDKTGSLKPLIDQPVNFAYIRFHGPGGNYRGSYTDDVLSEYAQYIAEWLDEGKEIYSYFNNTMGEAIKNLRTLKGFVDNQPDTF